MELSDKVWLEQKYLDEGMSATEIAKIVERHPNIVYGALRRHGIPTKKSTERSSRLGDKKWLEEQYCQKYRTYEDIANELGTSKHAVYRTFKKLGIEGRTHTARIKELNDKKWLRKKYVDEKLSIKEIAALIGCSPGAVSSSLIWSGVKLRGIKDALQNKYANGRWGQEASNWRGGRRKVEGYMYIYEPTHPLSNRQGLVMEHRLMMEKYLGRTLELKWVIHHMDGEKLNNLLDNLMLLPNRGIHAQVHFEANKEIAYLKKMALAGITDFEPYKYKCLPARFKDIHNPFDL